MADRTIHIVGTGMMTPLGDSAELTAAAVRAGVSVQEECSVMNKRFEPMTMALVPDDALPPLNDILKETTTLTGRQIRMLRLAGKPLSDALSNVPEGVTVPLFLAVPEAIPECPAPLNDDFISYLHIQCDQLFDLKKSRIFSNGRASGIEAISEAFNALMSDSEQFVLVGGCDTYLDLYLLAKLDNDNRVLANGVMDGFVPGESAAFLLLASDKVVRKRNLQSIAQMCLPSVTDEPGHRYSEDEPYKGDGLSEAVTGALEALGEEKVETIFAGFNGENFFAKEWGVAFLRNHDGFIEEARMEHPADCYGDSGAAAAPLLTGLAAIGLRKEYVNGPCLIFCSSEKEKRGAVCVKL